MTANAPGLPNGDQLLNCHEASQALRLSISTLERMRLDGSGPHFIKLGNGKRARVAYLRRDLNAWLEAKRFSSTAQYSRSGT